MLVKSKLKYIQTLGQKKFRQEEGLFIAEGPKIVTELLNEPGVEVTEVFASPEWIEGNKTLLKNTAVTGVSDTELERISQLSTPHQVLALVRQFGESDAIVIKGRIVLALDAIRDPGNLGTIIRIADWFGIRQVVCSPDSADCYNPKVVQATMGSIARVKLYYRDLDQWLSGLENTRVYATLLEGQDITGMKKINEGIILVGNESAGISPGLLQHSNVRITIPRKGKAESLNAAVATGIILSHLA